MYRDDLEALKARVETLDSANNAERKAREAAEAGEKAAKARAEELALLLKRSHGDPDPPFWRRHGITVVALLVAIAAAGAFIYQRTSQIAAKRELAELKTRAERLHRELVRSEVKRDALQEKLSRVEWRLRERQHEKPTRAHAPRDTPPDRLDPYQTEDQPKERMGYLLAHSRPWARVFVDGKDTGRTTPIAPSKALPLKPGRHRVTFATRENRRYSFVVHIRAGQTAKLIKDLQ
jgi:hypothetical protein